MRRYLHILIAFILLALNAQGILAQLSPGPLSKVHAHLEGMSNCTKCHDLGKKVTNKKCLDCHTLLRERIEQEKGYHYSPELRGKRCVSCHSDHHGRDFEIVRFDEEEFDHGLTGYILRGAHARQECKNCHKSGFIRSKVIREKEFTYLGLSTDCQSCHEDYHQNTLEAGCEDCHDFEAFRPASRFSHDATPFPLKGKHKEVDCEECHEKTVRNGKDFQEFAGIAFSSCKDCHTDVHDNKFGPRCKDCHNENSFSDIRGLDKFDHSRTRYPLEGKHRQVDCSSCHKGKLTDPLPFGKCTDCHEDYHRGDFSREGEVTDCSNCHTVQGFQPSTFTIDKHQETSFPLDGAHLATPCFACHKKPERWTFRDIGETCNDCHDDIHAPHLDARFYPGKDCQACHNTASWQRIAFDHERTDFSLEGKHREKECRDCHTKIDPEGNAFQQFTDLGTQCELCHEDIHYGQFRKKGVVPCENCHGFSDWAASRFDHQKTRFPLEGRHAEIACELCHKEVTEGEITYIQYKMEDIRCAACH